MKIIFSHPTGNANARAVLKGMQNAGLLKYFYTSIASFPGSFLNLLSNIKFLQEIKRRQFETELQAITYYFPFKEFGRLICSKFKILSLTKHETGYFCIDKVYHYIDYKVSKSLDKKADINAVYAYEDAALESFKSAKKKGVLCLYDLPIGYWKSARILLKEEFENNPSWAPTLTGFKDSEQKLKRKDEELALADRIFVASTFTKDTLLYFDGSLPNIEVIPYGFPTVKEDKKYIPLKARKLKILFVGGLSQRKGISYVFESVKGLEDKVSLTIVGRKAVSDCEALNEALKQHTWIPSMPHHKVLECMQAHDILVFPSLFEGFGMVITEAMSQGTPVITTNRTAGPDLITNNVDGWIVETSSSQAIKNVLEHIVKNPEKLNEVGLAAQETAKKRPWDMYETEMAKALK